jgi:hypothetical protein
MNTADKLNRNKLEGINIMTRKTLIALAAVAALTVGFGTSAQARTHVNIGFGINLGSHGFLDGDYGHGYYDDDYGDEDCGYQMVRKVRWNHSHTRKIVRWTKEWVCG